MSDPAELRDTRVPPRALLPMRMPAWAMAALAAAMLLVVVVNMLSSRTAPPAAPVVPAAPPKARTPPVQRLSEIMPIPEPAPERPVPVPQPVSVASPGYTQPDPIAADRTRREYESLFAENVVTRRTESKTSQAQTSAPTPQPAAAAPGSTLPPPGLVLLEGTVIEAVLTNRLEGSRDGPVNVMVTSDVYVGHTKVIPKGSRILGTASRVQDQDTERLAVAFHRVLTPDGRSISLDKDTPGLDQQGAQGFKDQVDRHYLSTFGAAAAVGVLAGLGQWMTGYGYGYGGRQSGTVVVTQGTDAVADAAAVTLRHFLNRLPTIRIREGHRVRVYLTSDVTIPT